MNAKRKAAHELTKAANNSKPDSTSNTAHNQRLIVVAALEGGPKTTYELMRKFDIYHPPARVRELRKRGYRIVTHWRDVTTEAGKPHRVGLYVLETSGASNG